MKVTYSDQVRRNARHLIELGQAVLDGKPIWNFTGPKKDRKWRMVSPSCELFSKVCRSYRAKTPDNKQMQLFDIPPNVASPETIAAAWAGKPIQFRFNNLQDVWYDVTNKNHTPNHWADHSFEYRIKPEPPTPQAPKWRPWTLEEVPVGSVVRRKSATTERALITRTTRVYGKDLVVLSFYQNRGVPPAELLRDYVLDAEENPCGILES